MEHITETIETYNYANLEDRVRFALDGAIEKEALSAYTPENILSCVEFMDYTTLKVSDTPASVAAFTADLLRKLRKYELPNPAAICVFPRFVSTVKETLAEAPLRVAAVGGGFPFAQTFLDIKVAECRQAIAAGADEIDVVLSVGNILEERYEEVYRELLTLRKACQGVTFKVINESGELKTYEHIFRATLLAAYAGADFVKTSTGKVPVNATPEAVYVMCDAIRQFHEHEHRRVGIKVAGGVSRVQNAIRYLAIVYHLLGETWLTPSLFRFGTSQLLDDILKELKR